MEEEEKFIMKWKNMGVYISRCWDGCEVAVTARTRYDCVRLRECGELLHGKRFTVKLKWFARPM